jgi:cytoskeleton protein RodZ
VTDAARDITGADPAAVSAGRLLRAARDTCQLSVEQVAQQLNLDIRKVIALESDDYGALPPALYVKGYIRAIAGLLGVRADEVLAAYQRDCNSTADPELTPFASRPAVQLTSNSPRMRVITVGLIVILAALVGLWWQANHFLPGDKGVVAPPEPPAPAIRRIQPDDPAVGSYEASTAGDLQFADFVDADLSAAPVVPPADGITVDENSANDQAAAPAADRSDASADLALEQLTLTLSAASWIEITDGRAQRLYFDLAKPAQTIAVAGVPPFALVIGNAAGVALRFRDAAVDLRPFARQGVARLTLGDEAAGD